MKRNTYQQTPDGNWLLIVTSRQFGRFEVPIPADCIERVKRHQWSAKIGTGTKPQFLTRTGTEFMHLSKLLPPPPAPPKLTYEERAERWEKIREHFRQQGMFVPPFPRPQPNAVTATVTKGEE